MVPAMNKTVDRLLDLCHQPYLKVALELAKATKLFIEGDSVQIAIRIVSDSKLNSVKKAMEEMPRKKDVRSAAEGVLIHLMDAYYLFESYYKKMPKKMEKRIPGLWEFNEFHRSVRKVVNIQDTIARICLLKAVYHKALGDDPTLVKEWLCEKEFPCNKYEILADLLGQNAALEYIASNPGGSLIAGQYLTEKGVSLEDYQARGIGLESSDGISFGMEDPIIYLD